MKTDIWCSVHKQIVNKRLSLYLSTSLDRKVPPPTFTWCSNELAIRGVCWACRFKGELFQLDGFPHTWPMISSYGERGLCFSGSLQLQWVKHRLKFSTNTITAAAKSRSPPFFHFPLSVAINFKLNMFFQCVATYTGIQWNRSEKCFLLLAWISPLILFMELQHKQCVPVKEGSW